MDLEILDFKSARARARQRISEDGDLVPGCRPILELAVRNRAPLAVLFLHGFSATPFEGRELAAYLRRLDLNVYAPRLAGHGRGREAFDAASWQDWLKSAEEGLSVAKGLGREVVIVGHSGGGVLGAMLAHKYPANVKALILGAPAFSLKDPLAAWTVFPPVRWFKPKVTFRSKDPRINKHWVMEYGTKAVAELVKAGRVGEKALFKLELPLAIFQGSRDEIVSTAANLRRFPKIQSQRKQFMLYPTKEHNVVYKSNPYQKRVFGWIKDFIEEIKDYVSSES